MPGDEVGENSGLLISEDHPGAVEVVGVHLTDEEPASSARRQDVQSFGAGVAPHRDDAGDPLLAGGDHRCDCGGLGAEAGAAGGVDADPRKVPSVRRLGDGRDIAEEPATDLDGVEVCRRLPNQVGVRGPAAGSLDIGAPLLGNGRQDRPRA